MSFRRWLIALGVLGTLAIAGCPSATVPVKPADSEVLQDTDGGTPDAGEVADAGAAAAGDTADAGTAQPAPPDAGAAQSETVVPAGGNDSVETREEKAGREAREKEEAEKKALEQKRAEEEARVRKVKSEIESRLTDAGKLALNGDPTKALDAYQAVLKDYPSSFVAHYDMGVLYDRMGNTDKAISEYKAAIDARPDFGPANDNLDRLYIRTGRLMDAEENARRIPVKDNSVVAQNQLIRVLLAKGDYDSAETLAKKVLKIDERNTDAMLALGEIWFEQKKFELAKQVLDNAVEINPNVPALWNLMAFVHLALDQRTLALDAFRKAAALREDFPEAHNNLGAMLNEVNDCDGAIHELELAVKYAPGYAQAHLNLGNAYRCARKYEEAQKEYDKTLELEPKSTDAIFNLAILFQDGDLKLKWDDKNELDSDKLERLNKAKEYFDRYRAAGGDDDRLDRYYAETEKAISKEQERLAHLQEYNAKKKKAELARKEREEKEKKAREEKEQQEKLAREARLAEINSKKVQGLSDVEDDPPLPEPKPVTPPPPPPAETSTAAAESPGSTSTAVAPPPPPPPVEIPQPVRHMQKIAPMEDEPGPGPGGI